MKDETPGCPAPLPYEAGMVNVVGDRAREWDDTLIQYLWNLRQSLAIPPLPEEIERELDRRYG